MDASKPKSFSQLLQFPSRKQIWLEVAAGMIGGLIWGTLFSLAPFELLFLGAIFWIPLFFWLEYRRVRFYGFWPGAVARYFTIFCVVLVAAILPLKFQDRGIVAFPSRTVTLGQLESAGVIYLIADSKWHSTNISLSSERPTHGEPMTAINEQTKLITTTIRCGNGSTILFGSHVGRIFAIENQR